MSDEKVQELERELNKMCIHILEEKVEMLSKKVRELEKAQDEFE